MSVSPPQFEDRDRVCLLSHAQCRTYLKIPAWTVGKPACGESISEARESVLSSRLHEVLSVCTEPPLAALWSAVRELKDAVGPDFCLCQFLFPAPCFATGNDSVSVKVLVFMSQGEGLTSMLITWLIADVGKHQ